ncbi:MAG: hypothetical protein ACK53Y_09030, partial [bacterium]
MATPTSNGSASTNITTGTNTYTSNAMANNNLNEQHYDGEPATNQHQRRQPKQEAPQMVTTAALHLQRHGQH